MTTNVKFLKIISSDTSIKSIMVVVGGRTTKKEEIRTEFCDVTDSKISCTDQDSSLLDYVAPPLLLKIEKDFEKTLYDKCLSYEGSYPGYVLALSATNSPVLINGKGKSHEVQCPSETISQQSCSIIWDNKVYIYGSSIIRLDGTHLKTVGQIERDHDGALLKHQGACSTMGLKFVFLCFNKFEDNQCKRADNPLGPFTEIVKSKHNHIGTKTGASESKL